MMNLKRIFIHSFWIGLLLLPGLFPAAAQAHPREITAVVRLTPPPSAPYMLPEPNDEVLVLFINGAVRR